MANVNNLGILVLFSNVKHILQQAAVTGRCDVLAGVYLTVAMTLTSLSIALTVFILQLYHAGPSSRRRVPAWMSRLFIHRVGPALGVRRRPSSAAVNHVWNRRRTRVVNTADPEVATGGYLPLAMRSARERVVEGADTQQSRRPAHQNLIARHLKLCLERHRAEQELDDIITEWRVVAVIFDRLMFWLFLVGTVGTAIFILLVLPLSKPDVRQSRSREP